LVFSARDPSGLSSERITVEIIVHGLNHPPLFFSDPPASVYVCQTYSYQVKTFDPDGDPVQLTVVSGPPGLRLNNDTVLWTTDRSSLGNASVSLRLDDRVNAPVFQNFSIRVLPVNRPPVARILSPADGASFTYGAGISFRGQGSDPDGDRITFLWMTDGKSVGNVTEFNTTLKAGAHSISLSVSDGSLVAYHNITVTVWATGEPGRPGDTAVSVDGDWWLCASLIAVVSIVAAAFVIRDRLRLV
jgi:hypothetical protein